MLCTLTDYYEKPLWRELERGEDGCLRFPRHKFGIKIELLAEYANREVVDESKHYETVHCRRIGY